MASFLERYILRPLKILWQTFLTLFYPTTPYTSGRRLDAQILSLESELEFLKGGEAAHGAALAEVRRHLDDAKAARKIHMTEAGWLHLHAAQRARIDLLSPTELTAYLINLKHENTLKLSQWRQQASNDLCKAALAKDATSEDARIYAREAAKIRDGMFDNVYRNKEILKTHIGILLAPMLLGVVIFLSAGHFAFGRECSGDPNCAWDYSDFEGLNSVTLFLLASFGLGLAGASISAISGMASSKVVPNQFDHPRITIARTVVGGASAMLAYFIVQTDIINGVNSPPYTLMIAFALGFSEKLLVGVMDRVGSTRQ